MELKDLVGEHLLSGIDTSTEKGGYDKSEDANVVRFVLDGKTYKATEDPSDGYRSYCGDIEVCEEKVSNTFPPQRVLARMEENNNSENDIIEFIDVVTGKIVLEVGTDNSDSYYPTCVMSWKPENLAINNKPLVKERLKDGLKYEKDTLMKFKQEKERINKLIINCKENITK